MPKQPMPKKLGRYTIVRELGKGAMGIVYEGLDPKINRRVAIKTARKDVMESTGRVDEMMERFLREATSAGSLNHPNIITIYDAGEEEDLAYIAMEFLDGGDLFDVMEQKQRFTPEEAVDIAATICDALAEAHEHGIIHRDVKPANILMPKNASLKVADFGIARIEDSNLTQEGAMIGTPHYMSPEQFMGQRADARSDLFSVAIILYEILTSEKPFAGEALSTVMHNVIKSEPVDPSQLNYAIPPCLTKVILKALAKRPRDRYQTARAMAAALRESLKPNPDPAVTLVPGEEGQATVLAQDAEAQETVLATDLPEQAGPPKEAKAGEAAKKKLPLPALIGAVAVVGLVGTVAIAFLPRGGPHFEKAVIYVVRVDNLEALADAEDCVDEAEESGKKPNFSAIDGCDSGSGTVYLTKAGDDTPSEEVVVAGGVRTFTFKTNDWTEFTARVESAGYKNAEKSYAATQPRQTCRVTLIMLKEGALE